MNTKDKTFSLEGKRIIVLGGSSGIGLATAMAAGMEGAGVVIASSNQARMEAAIKRLPSTAKGYVVDLSEESQIRDFFKSIGKFDHLVYTAGENISISAIAASDAAHARKYFDIRYWGAYLSVKYAGASIREGGSITLTSGIASMRPGKGWSLGASICGAMEGLTRALAMELSPIRVNIVSPGVVKTDLWSSLSATDREQLYKATAEALPVKKVGEADEIAQTYLYLMKQSYSTGQVVTVDGGGVLV
ncbi:SDR family oxidoreductase [Chryseolinea soli]|uniref:SDR family oxidoreductase n=1 Tax=Chryseolinea soli TaxID=2321403 RepID=A0A385SRY9_9BACT|nr:SDR family oxidoreductase [Chryseolinea soli]AYB31588.1 SDR family oxidoreductase [Chryseolinea soli]